MHTPLSTVAHLLTPVFSMLVLIHCSQVQPQLCLDSFQSQVMFSANSLCQPCVNDSLSSASFYFYDQALPSISILLISELNSEIHLCQLT